MHLYTMDHSYTYEEHSGASYFFWTPKHTEKRTYRNKEHLKEKPMKIIYIDLSSV